MSDSKTSHATQPASHSHHEEELVHVPEGQSRLRFILMVIIIIGILVAFSITPAMMGTFSRPNQGKTFISWEVPGSEARSMDMDSFRSEKRRMKVLEDVLRAPMPLPIGPLDAKSDEMIAKFLVLEELALQSGMRVGDEEMADFIVRMFGSGAAYLDRFQGLSSSRGLTPKAFEEALGRWMLVNRYLMWTTDGATLVDPAAVEQQWLDGHQEYAFDYIVVETEDYREHAEGQLLDDVELQAWFDAKPDNAKRKYFEGPYFAVEATFLTLPQEVAPEKLIAAYPPAEDEDLDAAALGYYELYHTTRFKKPEGVSEGEEDLYFAFEDVKDICAIEVGAFNSMNVWLLDLAEKQTKGETIDLAAEAERLGLEYGKQAEALTRDQWNDSELPWVGNVIVNDIIRSQSGQMSRRITVEEHAFVITRVTERLEPTLPDFDTLRSTVAEDWVKEKMGAVAVLRLEQVRDILGNRPADPAETWELVVDVESFGEAATQRGFVPQSRDYVGRQESRRAPEGVEEDKAEAAVREFLFRNSPLFQLKDGQVAEPRTNPIGEYAFLVRLKGARDADIHTKLSPTDVTGIEGRLAGQSSQTFLEENFASIDWYKTEMGLSMVDPLTGEPLL